MQIAYVHSVAIYLHRRKKIRGGISSLNEEEEENSRWEFSFASELCIIAHTSQVFRQFVLSVTHLIDILRRRDAFFTSRRDERHEAESQVETFTFIIPRISSANIFHHRVYFALLPPIKSYWKWGPMIVGANSCPPIPCPSWQLQQK